MTASDYVPYSYRVIRARPESSWERYRRTRLTVGERALGLLRSYLTAEQWRALCSGRSIQVRGSRGGYYEMDAGSLAVRRLRRWRNPVEYCIAAPFDYPYGDRALALILMIQTDERLFRRTAVRVGGLHLR